MRRDELHSIVVPMFNEESVLEEFLFRTCEALRAVPDYEIIVVDDGSRDGTFAALARNASRDPHIRVLRFARNFGHQIAITAGIDVARGDTVTVIDADLQDPPELICDMIALWREGADVVYAIRRTRAGEGAFKRWSATGFYRVLRRLGDVDAPVDAGDFRLMSRRATEALVAMREQSRYVRGLVGWIGMERAYVQYDREPRHSGATKYPLRKMLHFATDGIVSFSKRPLQLAVWLGLLTSALGFLVAAYATVMRLTGGHVVEGWSSTIVAILLIGGVQLLMLGVIGEYLGRVYDEVRQRPLYLVSEALGFDPETAICFSESPLPPLRRRAAEKLSPSPPPEKPGESQEPAAPDNGTGSHDRRVAG